MDHTFYALISRMRYIERWGLMRNSIRENVQEHSHMVAVLAHALAVIDRDIFGGDADPNEAAAEALFHDASEILTGDMPTPIKYHNEEIMSAYKRVEKLAADKLLLKLPEGLREAYMPLLTGGGSAHALVKAADKLAAYIKCVEEMKAGNDEFRQAREQLKDIIDKMPQPAVKYFMENCIPAFELTLDEISRGDL